MKKKRGPGRPKGSKNKSKSKVGSGWIRAIDRIAQTQNEIKKAIDKLAKRTALVDESHELILKSLHNAIKEAGEPSVTVPIAIAIPATTLDPNAHIYTATNGETV